MLESSKETGSSTNEPTAFTKAFPNVVTVQLFQRKVIQTRPNFSRTELFGLPLMISFEMNTTLKELYNMIEASLVSSLSNFPGLGEHCHLRIVNESGRACGLCSLSEQCAGCELPISDEIVKCNPNQQALAVDWDEVAVSKFYDGKVCSTKISRMQFMCEEHSSMKMTEEEEKQKHISLEDCVQLFEQQEQLSVENKWLW